MREVDAGNIPVGDDCDGGGSPVTGEKLQAIVQDIVSTPSDIVEKYKAAVTPKN